MEPIFGHRLVDMGSLLEFRLATARNRAMEEVWPLETTALPVSATLAERA